MRSHCERSTPRLCIALPVTDTGSDYAYRAGFALNLTKRMSPLIEIRRDALLDALTKAVPFTFKPEVNFLRSVV
jgi:hypothetical protein